VFRRAVTRAGSGEPIKSQTVIRTSSSFKAQSFRTKTLALIAVASFFCRKKIEGKAGNGFKKTTEKDTETSANRY
jgi:hypothetical protein